MSIHTEAVERCFKLPDNSSEVIQAVINSIPDTWSWLDGSLRAPERLVASGEVAVATGYRFRRFHEQPIIIGAWCGETKSELPADYYSIIVDSKRPEFVVFGEAGLDNSKITFHAIKDIVDGLIGVGYTGNLSFYSGYRNNEKYNNPARCGIYMQEHETSRRLTVEGKGKGSIVKQLAPPSITVYFNPKYGSEDIIKPILQICQQHHLEEFSQSDLPETHQPLDLG